MAIPAAWSPEALDPRDPNPWAALYLDHTLPMSPEAKVAWLTSCSSRSRQFLLPVVRPLARLTIILVQLLKIVMPKGFTSSRVLHKFLRWGLSTWVRPDANLLILRHFNMGSEVLDFIARNVTGVQIPLSPLKPTNLAAVENDLFLQHDLNLFNFIIRLNAQLQEKNLTVGSPETVNYDGITDGPFPIEPMPDRWTNILDLETAIELFTPVYQLFLTDNDFWRACNSLQLDETVGLYIAKILQAPDHLILVNNKHPLVPLPTLRAGYRLVLHGLSSEILHAFLVQKKRAQSGGVA